MTIDELIKKFETLPYGDTEAVHSAADEILLEALRLLGPDGRRVADAYDECVKEEEGFWYA